jgi:hypothetical protein
MPPMTLPTEILATFLADVARHLMFDKLLDERSYMKIASIETFSDE